MKNKKLLIFITVIFVVAVIASGLMIYLYSSPEVHADDCRPIDRLQNNCIPAGNCRMPGEGGIIIDGCIPPDYDHRREIITE